MPRSLLFFFAALATATTFAAEPVSALTAGQALSKAQQRNIARFGAKAGKPSPEIWTIVTRDPKGPNGLREHTVTAGTVVATRASSDLAPKITSGDVIGMANIKVDSDQLAELAAGYAAANNQVPASFDYDLRKEGEEAAPLWTITAFDEAGTKLGALVVAAKTGAVISHEGFLLAPEQPNLTSIVSEGETASAQAPEGEDPEAEAAAPATTKKRTPKPRSASTQKERPSSFRRAGGHLQKFFTGKNTIGR